MRLLLIDDHALFLSGLKELLERRQIEVVLATGDGAEGVAATAELQPDVVLLDVRMARMNGLEVLRRLRVLGPRPPVVMLTTSEDESDLLEALREGANGYLLKDMEPEDLIIALQRAMEGQTPIAPELGSILARVLQGQGSPEAQVDDDGWNDELAALTPREREILCLLAAGQSNKTIGRNLGITEGTVKLHVKSILQKLNIHSRVEAAVIAVQRGLCS